MGAKIDAARAVTTRILSKYSQFWYYFDMSLYDDIYEVAADNYGLITSAEVAELGGRTKDLARFVGDGRLSKVGRGVYRISHHVPTRYDAYAESVALVGPDAYLFGESVLALCELMPTNSYRMFVATPRRVRKSLPESIVVTQRAGQGDVGYVEGIPSQSIPGAIRTCRGTVMEDRLADAARRARELGYIGAAEEADLLRELER